MSPTLVKSCTAIYPTIAVSLIKDTNAPLYPGKKWTNAWGMMKYNNAWLSEYPNAIAASFCVLLTAPTATLRSPTTFIANRIVKPIIDTLTPPTS